MAATPQRLTDLRENLLGLTGSDNALVRSAVRIALNELDQADLTPYPHPHLERVTQILDAVLNPENDNPEGSAK